MLMAVPSTKLLRAILASPAENQYNLQSLGIYEPLSARRILFAISMHAHRHLVKAG